MDSFTYVMLLNLIFVAMPLGMRKAGMPRPQRLLTGAAVVVIFGSSHFYLGDTFMGIASLVFAVIFCAVWWKERRAMRVNAK